MSAKRQEPTLTIRLSADIAERLSTFVASQEDWSKTEVVAVALNDFLAATDKQRITSLVRYRTRKSAPTRD